MKIINFEGLGLYFNINSIAIKIGKLEIYWYAIFIVIAFIIAILFCRKDNGKYKIKFEDILELLIIVIPVSIICARLYYIVFNIADFIQNPIDIFNIRNGGLAIYGGLIGGIITIIIFCKIKQIKILDMLDYIVPFVPLGQSIGRWGNFFNGEAHGTITNNIIRMGIVENGKYIEVHPTFLYESIATLIIFIILYTKRNKRSYEGQLIYLYLFLYAMIRAFIEGLRTDSLMLGNIRISQLLSIILVIIFGGILVYKGIKEKRKYE